MTHAGVIRYMASLKVGEYRSLLGAIRRAWKSKQTGRPVKRLRRTIRQDARDVRWAHDVKSGREWVCGKCGVWSLRLEAAHIVPRRYLATRYDINNGLALCHKCHRWAHSNHTEFMGWVQAEYPTVAAHLRQIVPSWKGWHTTQKASG